MNRFSQKRLFQGCLETAAFTFDRTGLVNEQRLSLQRALNIRKMHRRWEYGLLAGLIPAMMLLLLSCHGREDRTRFYHPAEFEPVRSTCFIWSTDYYEIIPRLAGIVSRKEKVTLFLGNQWTDRETIQKILLKHGCNLDNVELVSINKPLDNIWIRDYGPAYLVNRSGEKKLVEFNYFWSNPGFIEEVASPGNLPVIRSPFNSTGGSREVNGKGTVILCESHEMDVNQEKTKQEIEQEMIRILGQKKIIWLKKGLPQDDSILKGPLYDSVYPKGVNGHVDEFCRFADPGTILISHVTEQEARSHPIYKEAKKRLDENYRILVNATDQDGNKFNVIQVPVAPLIITDRRAGPEGKIVASVTSYMNFIIASSLVVLPSYVSANSGNLALLRKEQEVEQIFREAFPSREIIKLRADTINYYSGGFHCISLHEPLAEP